MARATGFEPLWASPPGETIAEILELKHLSSADLAVMIETTQEDIDDLLEGKTSISLGVARDLASALGSSVEFWMARDIQYRDDVSRLQNTELEWLREVPVGDMIKFGWVSPRPHPEEEVSACLAFFGVQSVQTWRRAYGGLENMAAFRTSSSFDSHPGSVAAWLRRGEIEAAEIDTKPWNPERFTEALEKIRGLTKVKDPHRFIPTLRDLCGDAGVAVAVVRAPSGCRASGAVRFLNPDKALVQLSFRHLSDDHFWFSFFHEAGHLLFHQERIAVLESLRGDNCGLLEETDPLSEEEESEASVFAAETLIPPQFQEQLQKLPTVTRSVLRFSARVGVSPGIVVGQLQHSGRVAPNRLNRLKRRYKWS